MHLQFDTSIFKIRCANNVWHGHMGTPAWVTVGGKALRLYIEKSKLN